MEFIFFWVAVLFIVILFFIMPYMIPILIFKKVKRKVLTNYEDSGKFMYERYIPENYNCAVASMLYDVKIDYKQDYVATFFELKIKGYIDENNNVTKKDQNQLLKNERFVLYTYKNFKKLNKNDFKKFEKTIVKDMIQLGFLNKNMVEGNNLATQSIMTAFMLILLFSGEIVISIAIAVAYAGMIVNKFSKEGKLEKEKIAKLRIFLDKNTELHKKTENELIWDRYLPFAVALDINNVIEKNLVKELEKKYL